MNSALDFETFGHLHIIILLVTFGIFFFLPWVGKNFLNEKYRLYIVYFLIAISLAQDLLYDLYQLSINDFDLGDDKIIINAIPSFIDSANLSQSFNELIYNIKNDVPDESFSESDFISKIISKSLSIKNGKSLKVKEQQYIINSLFACKETMICPFNNRTFVKIDFSEIENMF